MYQQTSVQGNLVVPPMSVKINESVNVTPEEYQQLIDEDIVCTRNDSKKTRHFGSRQLYLGADHLTFEGRVRVISPV